MKDSEKRTKLKILKKSKILSNIIKFKKQEFALISEWLSREKKIKITYIDKSKKFK